jgi:TRAP-type mannitol/chloroaromatic compound transport system substrate-binding protein
LKMRMPGMAGEVLKRAGAVPVNLPGSEIFTALQTGGIDATEWVGPYNDVAFGLHQIARYYYYPGWQEPGPSLECIVNRAAWDSLPADLQAIVRVACQAAALDMLSDYMARNASALAQLEADGQVEIRAFPDSVLEGLRDIASEYVEELARRDPIVARVWASYGDFLRRSRPWQHISELAMLSARPV